jgi:hypothetical protein
MNRSYEFNLLGGIGHMFVYSNFPSVTLFLRCMVMRRGEALLSRVYRLIDIACCRLKGNLQFAGSRRNHSMDR